MAIEVSIPTNDIWVRLVGEQDAYVNILRDELDVTIHARSGELSLEGKDEVVAKKVVDELLKVLAAGQELTQDSVLRSVAMVNNSESPSGVMSDRILVTNRNKPVIPRTPNQKKYVDSIQKNTITFGIGPAGTGKSWLAVACAVKSLMDQEVERILLTRPAVEAGENLGFLPGDLMSKVDPYLRPLYDALSDMVGAEHMSKYFERNVIEVAPLAYMRGRTLNNSFVILDEAQNTTPQQMMMFLTRIGFNTKCVVTGDKTQVDLPGQKSGLVGLEKILNGIEGLDFVHLSSGDVVRHRIVQDIVDAYEARKRA